MKALLARSAIARPTDFLVSDHVSAIPLSPISLMRLNDSESKGEVELARTAKTRLKVFCLSVWFGVREFRLVNISDRNFGRSVGAVRIICQVWERCGGVGKGEERCVSEEGDWREEGHVWYGS